MSFLLAGAAACTPMRRVVSGTPTGPTPEDELRVAAAALEVDDFSTAAMHLNPLTKGCLDSPVSRRAALLEATMELDPANPTRSPRAAAALAARVLRASPTGDTSYAEARTLYRLALDAGAAAQETPGEHPCVGAGIDEGRLPEPMEPTTDERLRALSDTLRAQADSLAARAELLSARADSLERALARAREAERRAGALEEELNRIRQLLRGGTEPGT